MRVLRTLLAIVTSLSVVVPAWAERVNVEPWVGARITATDNAGLGLSGTGRDLVFDIRAGLSVRAEGSRLSLTGSASLESVVYTRDTQTDQLIPRVDLTGRWVAVERFLFVEASAQTTQTYFDPFGPSLTPTTTGNNRTVTQYRFSPYIESEPSPNLHLRARSDNIKTMEYATGSGTTDSPVDNSYFGRHTASLERDPRPLGWRLEAERSITQYHGDVGPLEIDIVRALVNMAINETASAGLRVGAERGNFLLDPGWERVYGGQATWRPSERTSFLFDAEHRFFGNSAHLAFTHRMPFFAWDLRASRVLETTPQSLFDVAPTDNVAALLDAILTTRFPDAAERAIQVQNIISRQGLPASTSTGIPIYGRRLSVAENVSLGMAFLGVRSTLALNVFAYRRRDALQNNPLATGDATTNNEQLGGALVYILRLTPTATAGLTVGLTRIQSLDTASASSSTREPYVNGQVTVQLAPRTSGLLGAAYRQLLSNAAIPGHEASVFVALDHRF